MGAVHFLDVYVVSYWIALVNHFRSRLMARMNAIRKR